MAKFVGPFEGYKKYMAQTVKELQLVKEMEEQMTKIHLQDAMLQLQILQGKLDASERLNKQPTKLIAIPEVLRQAGWIPKQKPLTDEAVGLLIGNSVEGQSWLMSVVRAVERAHGIGEKE